MGLLRGKAFTTKHAKDTKKLKTQKMPHPEKEGESP